MHVCMHACMHVFLLLRCFLKVLGGPCWGPCGGLWNEKINLNKKRFLLKFILGAFGRLCWGLCGGLWNEKNQPQQTLFLSIFFWPYLEGYVGKCVSVSGMNNSTSTKTFPVEVLFGGTWMAMLRARWRSLE